ncbi:MAG: ribosome small subunit-dependent GTPase A [Anaerolineales bacterium]
MQGVITKTQSGFYTVEAESGIYVCQLRGKLKRGKPMGDIAAVGDQVDISVINKETGVIEEVQPRRSSFIRLAPTPKGEYQQVIISNLDLAVFVFSCAKPAPRLSMLDRFLVIAEKNQVSCLILANKIDLVSKKEAGSYFQRYKKIGYKLLYTSAKTGVGIKKLKKMLQGKISLFTGPSGGGKSSLLNKVQPGLGLQVKSVSRATEKGRHTTVAREMYSLDGGGYIADTPGLKALSMFDVEPEELDGYFPEMRNLVENCAFSDCTHYHEPDCAIQDAVDAGMIHPERYISYLKMRFEEEIE